MRYLAVLFLALSSAPAVLHGQETYDLIDEVLAAYGGTDALASIESVEFRGETQALMRGRTGSLLRILKLPDHLRVEILYPSRAELRILQGDRGWRSDGAGNMIRAPGALYLSMVLQAARMAAPWILMEHQDDATRLPDFEYEGEAYPGLEIPLGHGLSLRAYVDPHTKLVVRTQTLLQMEGFETHFEAIYTQFREVEGVMFPVSEQNFASGVHTARTTIESIVVNPALGPDTFSEPELLLRRRETRSR